jgi:hypothetical protein
MPNQFLNLCLNPFLLLILSIATIVLSIVDTRQTVQFLVTMLMYVIMVLVVLRGTRNHHVNFPKKVFSYLIILISMSFVCDVIFYVTPQSFALRSALFLSAALIRASIFGYGWWLLTRTFAERQQVTGKTIITAIVAYLFIGIVYSSIYGAIWHVDANAFHISTDRDFQFKPWNLVMYFSFMTLTTVGYGDITPLNKWVMALSNFEAMTGSIYLAIIIARLVSLYSTSEQ